MRPTLTKAAGLVASIAIASIVLGFAWFRTPANLRPLKASMVELSDEIPADLADLSSPGYSSPYLSRYQGNGGRSLWVRSVVDSPYLPP